MNLGLLSGAWRDGCIGGWIDGRIDRWIYEIRGEMAPLHITTTESDAIEGDGPRE